MTAQRAARWRGSRAWSGERELATHTLGRVPSAAVVRRRAAAADAALLRALDRVRLGAPQRFVPVSVDTCATHLCSVQCDACGGA